MGWNPGGIQVEIDKNLAGLPAKDIPGGMTRNLWGSVKSSVVNMMKVLLLIVSMI